MRPELVTFFRGRHPGSLPRLGLIVSKKVGNSVVRNKVKRKLRELFRQKLQFNSFDPSGVPMDVVIIARERASKASFQLLESSWEGAVKRSKDLWARSATPSQQEAAKDVH